MKRDKSEGSGAFSDRRSVLSLLQTVSLMFIIWIFIIGCICPLMSVNRILNKILAQDGVYDVFVLDGPSMVRLEIEESKNSGLGCRYENRGLIESRTKDLRVCVFSKNFLECPTDMLTAMVDCEGTVFGHDVPMCMPREKIHDGAVWTTSTFVVYPNSMPKSELKFVVLPHSLSFITENDGAKDVVAFNPSKIADTFLRKKFGFTEAPDTAMSTIVAMDLLND